VGKGLAVALQQGSSLMIAVAGHAVLFDQFLVK